MKLLEPSAHCTGKETAIERERAGEKASERWGKPQWTQAKAELKLLMKATRNWIFMYMTDRDSWICERVDTKTSPTVASD